MINSNSDLAKLLAKCDSLRQKKNEQNGTPKPSELQDTKPNQDILRAAGIKRRYQSVTFSAIERRGIPTDDSIRRGYEKAKAYAEDLGANIAQGRGLILAGTYGTLKTTISIAILRKWLDAGHGGVIVPMCSLIDNLCTMRILNRDEFARYEHKIRTTSLLVLDDLGGEDTDQRWVLSKIDSIITERYNDLLATIVTTNLTAKELEGTYSGRMLDRLKNTCDLIILNADSQRRHLWE